MPQASLKETELVAAIVNPGLTCTRFALLLRSIPASERFWMQNTWTEYACDKKLDAWRRVAAYQILLERRISYPRELRNFVAEAIQAMGVAEENIVDMTPAHNLPFTRRAKQKVRMAILPILMTTGPAAVYFAVDESERYVEQAAVYPSLDDLA